MKIHLIQPVIPHYRVDFFMSLRKAHENINFYSSAIDDIGVVSVHKNVFDYIELGKIYKFFGFAWQANVLRLLFKVKKHDIVIVNGNPRYLSTMFLILFLRLSNKKVVWWGQGWSANTTNISFKIRALVMRLADAVLLYTDEEIKLIEESISPEKIFSLNNGIDNKVIKPYVTEYIPDERRDVLLFIGRLTNKSKLDVLLKALALSPGYISLEVIGDGPNKETYQLLCQELNINNRVKFCGEIIVEKDIAEIANRSKIFVYPGNVGLSLIHSFNYGLPALIHSTRSQHMPEVACFKSRFTGEVFSIDDPTSLSISIISMLSDSEKLKLYSVNCIKSVSLSYNTDDMVKRFETLMSSIKNS